VEALEIGHQDFDPGGWAGGLDGAGGRGEMGGAAVGQIVAIDRSDDDVLQAEALDGGGDAPRLIGIERAGAPMDDGAVGTIARADIAHEHEGGGAMRETFADIRTACFLADRMEFELGQQRARTQVFGRGGRSHFDPVGMSSVGHVLS
jgi:hypothetical protein